MFLDSLSLYSEEEVRYFEELKNRLKKYCDNQIIKEIIENALDYTEIPPKKINNKVFHDVTLGSVIRSAMYCLGWDVISNISTIDRLDTLCSFIGNCFLDDTFWYLDFRGGSFVGHTSDNDERTTQNPEYFLNLCKDVQKKRHEVEQKILLIDDKNKRQQMMCEYLKTPGTTRKIVEIKLTKKCTFPFYFRDDDNIEVFKNTVFLDQVDLHTSLDDIKIETTICC